MKVKKIISINTIIFDFDGVLVDTVGDIATAANYTLRCLGLAEQSLQVIRSSIRGNSTELLRQLIGDIDDQSLKRALSLFLQAYRQHYCTQTKLFPDVLQVLQGLNQSGTQMAIATNKPEEITLKILEKLNLQNYFQFIVGPESIQNRKPHPEALLKILSGLSADPRRTLMVGDTPSDILAGHAANTWTCGVLYGYGKPDEIMAASPDFVISNLIDLNAHLLQMGLEARHEPF